MADSELSALTEVTTLVTSDQLLVDDAGTSKRITAGNLSNNVFTLATLSDLTFTDTSFEGSLTEEVYDISGTTPDLDPANGTIQTWTLSDDSTPVDALAEGQSILLMVDDGTDFTVTWPTITWVGGNAPVLESSGYNVFGLFKVGTTLYGARIGVVA